jgi:hypothetical protein
VIEFLHQCFFADEMNGLRAHAPDPGPEACGLRVVLKREDRLTENSAAVMDDDGFGLHCDRAPVIVTYTHVNVTYTPVSDVRTRVNDVDVKHNGARRRKNQGVFRANAC